MLKKLHSAGEISFVQEIDYQYDVRGWHNNICRGKFVFDHGIG